MYSTIIGIICSDSGAAIWILECKRIYKRDIVIFKILTNDKKFCSNENFLFI